jgi:thiamine biosynthesis protein ThiS
MINAPETESSQIVAGEIGITVNGEPRRVPAGLNVEGLLACLGVDPERVAIELNRAIVRRPAWATSVVEDGAQLEIVQFVGGG